MSVSRILVVARKEFLDASRDRRAVLTVLFTALFGPALVAFGMATGRP